MDFLGKSATFLRVVESGSFSAAARSLRMSLAAVSRQLVALEEELGAKLLVRTTRSLQLTEEGRRFHVHAARLVEEADVARASVRTDGSLVGSVVLSASVTLGVLRIVPGVRKLTDAHSRLALELRLEDRETDLVSEGVDIAVRAGLALPDTTNLVAQKLASFARFVVAAPSYLRKRGTPRTITSLAQHAAVVGARSSATWSFPEATVTVRPALRVSTLLGVREAVFAGVGIAILPDFVVHEALASGALKRLLPEAGLAPATAHALYRREARGASRIDAVVRHLRATMPL